MKAMLKNHDIIQIVGFFFSFLVSITLLLYQQDTLASITLGIVLATSIYLFGLQKRQSDSTEKILQRVSITIPFQVLTSQKTIFNELIRLVNECDDDDMIRATGLTPEPKTISQEYTHPQWFEAVAARIKSARKNDRALAYRTVMGKESPDQHRRSIEKRKEVFFAHGVLDRLSIRSVNMSWPMEILIVGDSIFLGFVSAAARDLPFRAGLIVTHKEIARNMREWYDDFLWGAGQDENLSVNK